MSKQRILEEAGVGEFLHAKVEATGRRIGEWLDTGNNMEKALTTTFAGFSALSAGAETAAHLLSERNGRKGLMQRGALHAAAAASLAGAGASLFLEGVVTGEKEPSKRR